MNQCQHVEQGVCPKCLYPMAYENLRKYPVNAFQILDMIWKNIKPGDKIEIRNNHVVIR